MNKKTVLMKAPVLTMSGYGQHSRMLFDALFEDPSLELFIENINWGICSFLTDDTDQVRRINACIQKHALLHKNNPSFQFDIFVHVTIPNEFERLGKFNVGVTAMVETNHISPQWIQKCNEMDLIVVPSEHSRNVAVNSLADWHNQRTGERGTIKIEKPVVVCAEGVDTNIFKPREEEYNNLLNLDFPTNFNFLHVGQWSPKPVGEDRKDISTMILYFFEAFYGRKDVGLILKTNMGKNIPADKTACIARIKALKELYTDQSKLPPVYLLHGNFTDEEIASLYRHPKVDAYLSISHGEGFCIPLLEAAMCELPVMTIPWSGHVDFLSKGKYVKFKYDLKEIPEGCVWDPILIKGSKWAYADKEDVVHRLRLIEKKSSQPKQWAKELREKIKEDFSLSRIKEVFLNTVKRHAVEDAASTINPVEWLQSQVDDPNVYNVLFTMPRSFGDVFLSTAVLDGLMKEIPKDAHIYFATDDKYAPVLKGNPHVHKILPWQQFMMMVDITEEVFDLALTPDVVTQYQFSNYIRRGQGRNLVEEYANYCQCEVGDSFIEKDKKILDKLPESYITIHAGYQQGHARHYSDWQEVVNNLKDYFEDIEIVQLGEKDDPKLNGVIDLRGETSIHEMAAILEKSALHTGVDSFPMHLACWHNVPVVAIFGSSYAHSTGPYQKEGSKNKFILLEAENRLGCSKACYKDACRVNKSMSCLSEIDPYEIFQSCVALLKE
jgi:ADP-heptose:LPS heptosyltransferase/glycosyltransferase involved in cell wall biosynthesis